MAKQPETKPAPEIEQPKPPLPPLKASPIPQVERKEPEPAPELQTPKDDDFTDGIYIANSGAAKGEEFALCVTDPDNYGNTHHLKNSVHYWNGREAEFKLQFDRK